MNPQQKIKWAILERARLFGQKVPEITPETVDAIYEQIKDEGYGLQDAREEIRSGGVSTKLKCEFSRHYESDAVAMKMPDGSWVGWTYWHGGGKHGEPEAIDWMGESYDVDCKEEEKLITVQTFSLPKKPTL